MRQSLGLAVLQALAFLVCASGTQPGARADETTDIVITEVMYNPASGDRRDDFIELHNIGTEAHNLQGFHFTSGVDFTFGDVTLEPGEYLVLCADEDRVRQLYGITNTVGNWNPETTLSNAGERIRLVNGADPPVEVEDFTYDDRNPWPILADGFGNSLERRNPLYDNDDPANWSASMVGGGWTRIRVTGLATSSRLYLYLTAAGTAYVDDVSLFPTGNPGDNRVANGGFESGLDGWSPNGNHAGSVATSEKAHGGSSSLQIVATGAGTSSSTSVVQDGLGLTNGDHYTLEFYVWLSDPGQALVARLSGATDPDASAPIYVEAGGGGATPGRENSVYALDIPPFIYPAAHSPSTPVASTAVTLLAAVRDDNAVASVVAHWDPGDGEKTAAMLDDGAHGDGVAGDGLYGAAIGSFPTASIVRYWFTAQDGNGAEGRFPFVGNPTETLGFYIQPPGIDPGFVARSNSGLVSDLPPVYHILVDPSELDSSDTNPRPNSPHLAGDLRRYRRATFIFNGEVFDNVRIRHRGQSSLGRPKKHWKVDFNKDHRFLTPFADHPEIDNMNIQSCEGDKSFLREWLEYKAMMDAGRPSLEMWHVRLYLNGVYRGLYGHLENLDDDWLSRTGLDNEGWLWKSYSQAKGGTGGFEMEEDAGNATGANAALASFISNMNNLRGQALVDYINANVDVGSFIDFLAVHQLTHDADHPAKNYLVYTDEDAPAGTWTYLLWDADLSHGRNFECTNCGLGGGVWNDCIRWDFWGDTQLLFGTSRRPKCDGPWNGVIDSFLVKTTEFRPLYYSRVEELLHLLYDPDVLNPIIDDMAGPLTPEVALDWQRNPPTYGRNNAPGDYPFHVGELKRWVQGRYSYLSSALATLTTPDIDDLSCERVGPNVSLAWTNGAAYDSIRVYRNGSRIDILPGDATETVQELDLDETVNTFRVASVVGGSLRNGKSCSVVLSSGGYTQVISEDFSPPAPANEVSVNCDATQTDGVLQLTPPEQTKAGSAFFLDPFSTVDFIADFDVRFDDPSPTGADGVAFILNTGDQTAICGAPGGAQGYFDGDGGTPVFPGYAVILDTWENQGEPSHNWIGFIDTGAGPGAVEAVDFPVELNGGGTFHCKLVGKAGQFTFLISNDGAGVAETEIFSYTDPDFTPQDAYFGFSAGTGGAFARHKIDNFVLQVNTGTASVTADFTASNTSGAVPLQVQFTNLSTNASSFSWDFGDGGTSTAVNPQHVYSDPGVYSVTLEATGAGGFDTVAKHDFVTAQETVKAAFTAAPLGGQVPLEVSFTNQSTGATSYEWDFGDGATSTEKNPAHTYARGSQFTVSLTARGPLGIEDTKTLTNYIQVDGVLDANFLAVPASGDAPLTVDFTDTSVAVAVTSWLWDFGDGARSVEQHPTHTYSADGIYTVSLQIFGYFATDTETKRGLIAVGNTGGVFVRGDVNDDDKVDISDPIALLNFLFLGGEALDCPDAGDADDTGNLDITDAIRILAFLFQGREPPSAPFPDAGPDPSNDELGSCARP